MVEKDEILKQGSVVAHDGTYACLDCGLTKDFVQGERVQNCKACTGERWVAAQDVR